MINNLIIMMQAKGINYVRKENNTIYVKNNKSDIKTSYQIDGIKNVFKNMGYNLVFLD